MKPPTLVHWAQQADEHEQTNLHTLPVCTVRIQHRERLQLCKTCMKNTQVGLHNYDTVLQQCLAN